MSWRDRAETISAPSTKPTGSWKDRAESIEPVATSKKDVGIVDKAESALQGFGQGALLGYLPNIQAAVEPATDKIFGLLTGKEVQDDRSYVQRRDSNIKDDLRKQEQAPGSYLLGNVAGSVATPAPGVGAASGLIKGTNAVAKIGRGALGGALSSAAYNPGDVEGEISGLQFTDRAKNAGTGGLIGGAGTAAGKIVSKGLDRWSNKGKGMQEAAEQLDIKALGGKKQAFKELGKKNRVGEVSKFSREKLGMGIGDDFESMNLKANKFAKKAGQEIKAIYSNVDQKLEDPKFLSSLNPSQIEKLNKTQLSPAQMGSEFLSEVKDSFKGTSGGKQVIGKMESELENLMELGQTADIEDLLKYRRSLDDSIRWSKSAQEMPASQEGLLKLRNFIRDKVDDRIKALDDVVGGNDLAKLKSLNKDYQNVSDVLKITGDRLNADKGNMALGLPELMVGSAVGLQQAGQDVMSGNVENLPSSLAKGLFAAAATKGARRYGPGIASGTLRGVGGLLQKDPTAPLARGAKGLIDKGLESPERFGEKFNRMTTGPGGLLK